MKNFAKLLMAVGVVFCLLSVWMMGISAQGTAEYVMDGVNLILGALMIAAGAAYLIWNKRHP